VFILNVLLLSGLATENGHVVHALVRNTSLFFFTPFGSVHIFLYWSLSAFGEYPVYVFFVGEFIAMLMETSFCFAVHRLVK